MTRSRSTLADTLVHVVAPVALGAAVYLLWRSRRLPVFRLVEAVRADALVRGAREHAAGARPLLPDAVLFAVPDALWVYALTAALALVWRGRRGRLGAAFVSLGVVLGVGSEGGQLAGTLPGTFDPMDAVLGAAAGALALFLVYATPATADRWDDA